MYSTAFLSFKRFLLKKENTHEPSQDSLPPHPTPPPCLFFSAITYEIWGNCTKTKILVAGTVEEYGAVKESGHCKNITTSPS